MPKSYPNAFDISGGGDVAANYLLIAGNPTQDRVINWGYTSLIFINGFPESSAVAVQHGLGVVPQVVIMGNAYEDSGRFVAFVEVESYTNTTFAFFVRDMLGGSHGPGNLNNVFPWVALG